MKTLLKFFALIALLFSAANAQPGAGPAGGPSGGPATIARIADDTTTNATVYPVWVTAAAGNLPLKVSSSKVFFNPSTGIFSATGFAGTINGNTFTAGTGTLTISAGKTTTFDHTSTFTTTDGQTYTFPTTSATLARTDAANTFTGLQSADGFATTTSAFNAQTGTSYTLLTSDNGKIVTLSNAGGITLTVPASLGAGFSCTIIQIGAGQVTVTASSTTIRNVYSNTKLVGQWAQATLTAYIADNFIFSGDTAP